MRIRQDNKENRQRILIGPPLLDAANEDGDTHGVYGVW